MKSILQRYDYFSIALKILIRFMSWGREVGGVIFFGIPSHSVVSTMSLHKLLFCLIQ